MPDDGNAHARKPGLPARVKNALDRLLWERDPDELGRVAAVGLRAVRILAMLVRDLADGQLTLRAMSLVYTTLLSLVPLLAVSFSVLKAFGAHNQIEPFLQNLLAPLGPKGQEITVRVIEFVENTRVGVLGAFGMALLLYTVVALIQKIERAFNITWHVPNDRPLARRFSDYLSVVLVGPVLVFSALGITASLTSTTVVQYLAGIEPFGTLIGLVGRLVPYLLVTIAFMFVYILVPNTRVRVGAALAGALVAAVLWVTLGWAFAAFIASSGKYTAIYSAFATLVLFMIWLYLAWMILLVGASVAFYVQHPEYIGRERGVPTLSPRAREALTLAVMHQVADAFRAGSPPPNARALAGALRVPSKTLQEALRALQAAGLLRPAASPEGGWLPARPLDRIAALEVLEAARRTGADSRIEKSLKHAPSAVHALAERIDDAHRQALGEGTVASWFERD